MVEQMGVRDPLPGVVYQPQDRLACYVEQGELGHIALTDALRQSFQFNADRVAIFTAEVAITYRELDDQTDRIAGALMALGLAPLERVLFQSANSPELLMAVIGCMKAGLIPVCTLAGHREHEIGYLGNHTKAAAHIVQGDDPKFDYAEFALSMREKIPSIQHSLALHECGNDCVPSLSALASAQDIHAAKQAVDLVIHDPFQAVIFQLSGGTSGVPKVIPKMQNEYLLMASRGAEVLGFRSDDVIFMPMPMMHNAAMGCIWLPLLLIGAAFAIPANMTPEAWGDVFRKARPSWVGLIRALFPRYEAMIDKGLGSEDSVRAYWTPDAARFARQKYGKPALGMFGMTEGMCMYPPLDAPIEILDWAAGMPISPMDEVRLLRPGTRELANDDEPGEMECRGPYTLCGYYGAPERNAEAFTDDGFYKTGDIMLRRMVDGKAIYAFAGRTRDIIDRGHEKVNCEEIETAISTHPAVAGCAAVGKPDPVLGERICIYVVVREGQTQPDVSALSGHMKALGMARFKWPEHVEIINELPLTKVGKLDKAVLREDIKAKVAGQ